MNYNHLYWIVPLLLVIGYLFGFYLGLPNHLDITIDYGEGIQAFTKVFNSTMNCSYK